MSGKKGAIRGVSYRVYRILIPLVCAPLIAGTCFVVGAIIAGLHETRRTIDSETNRYISELSQSVGHALEQRLDRSLRILESVSHSCDQESVPAMADSEGEKGKEELQDQAELQKRAELLQFQFFAYVFPDGTAICSDGVSRNFSGEKGVMKALAGESVIDVKTKRGKSASSRKNLPLFAVPIRSGEKDGKIIGALAAPASQQWADPFLQEYYYSGDVFFNVIKSDGTKVFMTENAYVSQFNRREGFEDSNNLFDTLRWNAEILGKTTIEEIEEITAAGGNSSIRFRYPQDGVVRTAHLTRVGDTDLCVWMVAANETITGGFAPLLHKAFFLGGVIILGFASLILVLLFFYRRNTRMLLTDPITGGYSPYRFDQEAERLIRSGAEGDYLFISVNIINFKVFNDSYGYDNSNRILKHVHDTIRRHMEDGERLTRFSADDFNVLSRAIPKEMLLQQMEFIVKEINEFNESLSEKQWLMFHVGVYRITDTDLPIVYIRDRANLARKKAKGDRKHMLYSCSFYEDGERLRLREENVLRNKMQEALKNQDFKLYLQPKVDISSGKVCGAEALVRWQNKDMGLISPDRFIPLFERTGFIRKLDLYMFEQVCILVKKCLDDGLTLLRISVNLSRVHLEDPEFLPPFVEVQKKHDASPEFLELELTETVFQEYQGKIQEAIICPI